MSAWKLVYRIFYRIALPILVSTSLIVLAGCTDPVTAANEKGALAQAQLDAGQLAEARQSIAQAIAERDDIPELHLLHARIELQAKSQSSAFGAYSSALALDSANMEALIGVSQLGLQLGRISESEDATNRILAMDPRQPNALLIKGLHSIIKRRFDDAIANADALLTLTPGEEGPAILKARALALKGDPDGALAVVEGARKTSGDTLSVALTLLELYRLRGDGNAMVPLLERIRKLSPEPDDYDLDEADTLYKLGQGARARAILRQRLLAPKVSEKTAIAITGLWKEYDPEPFDASGLDDFAKKAGVYASKAVARFYLDRTDPARAIAALSGAPYTDDIVALRARADVLAGRLDTSFAQAERILTNDRTHCDALIVKAQVFLAKRRADDAINAATLASTSCPQMPVTFLTLVRAQQADGNKAGALVAFRDAFDRNDQDAALVKTYTAWLEQQGNGARAVGIARRLANNAPSLLSAWRLYGEICAREPTANCSKDAEAGLTEAHRRFGIDPRSDEQPATGLFGRLTHR